MGTPEIVQLKEATVIYGHLCSTPVEAMVAEARILPLEIYLCRISFLTTDEWGNLPHTDKLHQVLQFAYWNVNPGNIMTLIRPTGAKRFTIQALHTPADKPMHITQQLAIFIQTIAILHPANYHIFRSSSIQVEPNLMALALFSPTTMILMRHEAMDFVAAN